MAELKGGSTVAGNKIWHAGNLNKDELNKIHDHDERYYTETEVDTKLNTKANTVHTHDDRYYTEAETDAKLGTKANTVHAHAFSELTAKPTTLSGYGITDAANREHQHALVSETEPTTGLYDGLMWYNPKNTMTRVYLNGGFRDISDGADMQITFYNKKRTKILAQQEAQIDIDLFGFNAKSHMLLVHANSTYLEQGVDYNVDDVNMTIINTTGVWKAGTVFDFAAFGIGTIGKGLQDISFANRKETVTIPTEANAFEIGLYNYNKSTHMLFVYANSAYLEEGDDYTVDLQTSRILKTEGMWKANTTFHVATFGIVGAERRVTEAFKMAQLTSTYKAAGGETRIPTGISEYNPDQDAMAVYLDGKLLYPGSQYTYAGDEIVLQGVTVVANNSFFFDVKKKIIAPYMSDALDGSLILRGSVQNHHLNANIRIGSLSELRTTVSSTVVDAINSLNQRIMDLENAASGGGGSAIPKSPTPPANPEAGDQWYDTATNRMHYYNNASWVDPLKYQ